MKIYWTRKSIPELTDLPPRLRNKNFKDAHNAISTHIEYWAGAAIAVICNLIIFRIYEYFFPAQNTFPYNIVRMLCVICPGMIIWYQFCIYGMRKHYRHILERGKATDNESDSEKLIREADAREYYQWRNVRRFMFILTVIMVFLSVLMLTKTVR
ncbi:hypothetical protein [Klebsiella quasivariicola]|uniref:hypothetical protein n=1 Tax=Klebsiella quasivariicola TaxID=2026240 RepID=UPI001CCA5ED6|nr:hypothetical protein [Klebsiella quasivariicola]MBZ9582908.1 hypothetical protein [Klebsiella quasivariicola]